MAVRLENFIISVCPFLEFISLKQFEILRPKSKSVKHMEAEETRST